MKTSSFYRLPAILIVSFLLVSFLPATVQAQVWYNSSWSYRKAITIDYTKVGTGPHTNFPVLISRADTDLQTKAQTDGDDILFTSSDGTTKLDHEIESYISASGTLVAWVKIPSLSSSANTIIYMYYGNASATSQQNGTGTWDASFKGVYHLNNAFLDATSNNYNGTNTGTTNVAGKISNGRGFVRSDGIDYIQIAGLMGSPTSFTISGWSNLTTADPNGAEIISLGDHVVLRADEINANKTCGIAQSGASTWNTTGSGINYAGTGWRYIVYTFDDVGNVQNVYVNGTQVASSIYTASPYYSGGGTNTFIGKHGNASVNFDFDGTIDEVRVSDASRSVGWVLTEYNNQNSPSTFYSVGSESCQLNISQIPTSNIILNYKFNGNANSETGSNNGTLRNSPVQAADRFSISNSAYTLNGSSQYVTSANSYSNPGNHSISIWFKTTTTSGGFLIGLGNATTGLSTLRDRMMYMTNSGVIYYAVHNGSFSTINSGSSYNDGNWHLATATLSSTNGIKLYMDGVQVAANAAITSAYNFAGYWRMGLDDLTSWPSKPTSNYFNGTIDDPLVYHRELNSTEVATIYNSPDGAGGNTPVCAGSPLNLTATTIGGAVYAWTGPNGFTSSSQNPTLTYSSAYAGVYTVQVTSGSCTGTAYKTVTTAATSSTISYAGSPYCKNAGTASVTFSGTAGGTYSSTAGLSINSTTGAVTLGTSTAGTYTVTYTVAGGCTATTSITVTAVPAATISYAGSPYDVNGGTASVTFSGTAGGTYSSTAGLSINATTGAVTLASSTPNTYTVTYTVAAAGGCSIYTTTTNITIINTTKTFTGTGNFSDAARWTGGTLPVAGENLVIDGACTVNNNAGTDNVAYGTLIIGTATGRTLNWATGGTNRLNVTNVSAGAGASTLNMTNGGTLIIRGSWTSTNLTFTSGAGTIEIQSSITLPAAYATFKNLTVNGSGITVTLGTVTAVTGNLTLAAGTFNANNLNTTVGGNWTNNGGNFTAGTGTVTFNSIIAGQTINGTALSHAFNNITIDKSGQILSVGGSATSLTLSGNLQLTNGSFNKGTGTTLAIAGNLVLNAGTVFQKGTGSVNFNGTSKTITDNTAALQDLGDVTVQSTKSVSLSTSAQMTSLGGAGSITLNANTLKLLGSGTVLSITTFNASVNSTTEFNCSGNFNIPTNTYHHLTINAAGYTATLNGNISSTVINGDLLIQAGTFRRNGASCGGFGCSVTIKGNITANSGTVLGGEIAQIIFAGTTQSISLANPASQNLGNMTIGTASTNPVVTLLTNVESAWGLTVGTTTASTGTLDINGKTLTMCCTGVLVNTGGTIIHNNGTLNISGGFGPRSITDNTGTQDFGNLIVAATGSEVDLATNIKARSVTLDGGTFDLNSFNLDVGTDAGTGSITGTGTILSSASSLTTLRGTGSLGGGTFNFNDLQFSGNGTTSTLIGNIIINGNLTLGNGTNTPTLNLGNFAANRSAAGGTLTVANGATMKIGGTNTIPSNYNTHSIGATSTIEYNGTAQSLAVLNSSQDYGNLTIAGSGTKTLAGNVNAGGTLTFSGATITTGTNILYLKTGGIVNRTSGHVIGNFKKYIATGATSKTFEIGDAINYTPVTVTFASVTTAGDLTISTVSGDHPNIATSTINPALTANRYWTLTNSGILFTNYSITCTFVAGDLDGGTTTSAFIAGRYSAGAWTYPTMGATTATSTQATGLTAFGDFQCGEAISFTKTWDGGAGTSNWGDAANWNTDGVPASTDNVDLTGANTININVAATTKNLLLNNASLVLTINSGNSLTVSGNLTLTAGTFNTAAAFATVSGTVNVAGGTVGFTGSGSQTIPAYNYNNLTSSSTGSRTLASSGTIGIAGAFTPGTNTYTITGSTINYNAAGAQTIAAFNYNNLTLSNSGTKTFAAGTSGIASALSITGSATANATTNSSVISYNGSANQTITALTYYGLNVSSTGGTVTGLNTTVTNFSINSGTVDLNTFTLTVAGTATYTSGTINNGTVTSTGATTTFAGTTFGAIVNATSDALYLNGSTFNNTVTLTKNGATNILGTGGNTFNNTAIIANSGTGYVVLGNSAADIFNADVTFTNTGSNALFMAFNAPGNQFNGNVTLNNTGTGSTINSGFGAGSTATYNGNIVLNNTSTGGMSFGAAGGITTLAATKTLNIGGTGFNAGPLYLYFFNQVGATPQSLTLTGTAALIPGFSSAFNGNVNFVAPQIYLNGATFNGTAYIEKNGATQNNSLGGNVFNGATTLVNSSSTSTAHFVLGFPTGVDIFNGDLTLTNTGTAGLYPAYNTAGHQFNGNIILNQTTGSAIWFCGGTGTATLATGKTISVGGSGFSSGLLGLLKFTQAGATAQTFSLTGTASLQIGPASTFNGNVNFTAPQIYLNGATYNGTVSFTKSGATNNNSNGGNIFASTTTITNSGAGWVALGYVSPDIFNGETTFNNNSASGFYVAHNSVGNQFNGNVTYNNFSAAGSMYSYFSLVSSAIYNGNIVVNNTSSGGIYFGVAGGSATLAATKTISVGATGFATGNLSLSFLTQSGTTPQALSLTGTALLSIGLSTTFNGNVNFTAPQLVLNGGTFNGTATLTKNGATDNASNGGNTFNASTTITNSSTADMTMGNVSPDIFNGDVVFTNSGSAAAALQIAYNSAGNQFNGNITFNNTGEGVFFGAGTGTATLAAGKTLSKGGAGFSSGTLCFARFTQVGATAQTFSLTGTALLKIGASSTFNGDLNFTAPQVQLDSSTFNGTTSVTKSGATTNVSAGGNIFNGVTTLSNSGSGSFDLGDISPETFNTDLTINNTGTYRIQIGINSVGNLFNGNTTINHGGNMGGINTLIARNAGATATFNGNLTLNCTNLNWNSGIVISNDAAVTINGNVIVSSTSGRGVLFGAATGTVTLGNGFTITDAGPGSFTTGTLTLKGFTQTGATAQNIALTGTANLTLGPSSQFNGAVNFSAPQLFLNGCQYNNTAVLTKNGATDNTSTGGNIFNAATTITNSGTGFLRLANTTADDFNSDATFIQTGSGLLQPAYATNCTIAGNLSTAGTATAITFGGTVTLNGTGAQSIGGSFSPTFNNLIISNTGNTVSSGVNSNVTSNLSVTSGTFDLGAFTANRLTAGGTLTVSNGATLKIGGTNTIPSNYSAHSIGATSTIEYSGTNQSVAVLNSSQDYGNLAVSGSGTEIISGNITVRNNLSITAGSLNINTYTLKIGGSISNSGTFTASNGTIEMNGSSSQTIPASTFAGNVIKGLTINNNAGVSLGGALSLTDVLTVSNGSLAADGYLTLKSTATATARVAQITSGAGTPITGNVIVERYVQGRRKYRLITSSVTTHANATLTSGQEAYSIWGNWQNGGINTTPNVGNHITGGSSADGFDPGTTNASLYTYDDVNRRYTGYTTANGKNTKYTPLKAGIAYFMFVYGDRLNSVFATNPHNTTLIATGTLKTGDQVYNTSSTIPLTGVTGRFTLLGNPFASPIDWATIPKTDLENTYWGWDPNLSSTGGYVTVTTTGTVTLQAPYSGSTGLNQYIQPGQGFFVKTSGASPVLTIREQDKVSNFNGNAFRVSRLTNDISLLAINLQYVNSGNKILADGVLAAFDASFSNQAGTEDGTKLANNSAESIAILNDTTSLSIDARQMPQNNDTLFLNVSRLIKSQYTLQIFAQQMESSNIQPYLQDRYLNTLVPLSLSDTNNIVFDVSAGIPASSDINRFRVVFQSLGIVLPVKYTSIKATQKDKNIQIDWEVAEESGIQKYEIERSVDGINFSKAGEVMARGNNSSESYNWLDVNPVTGNNYYRVRAIQADGKFFLSKIVAVKMKADKTGIKVYPNPVKNQQINIRLDEMEKGKYTLLLHNPQGQQIIQRVIDHPGGSFSQIIYLSKMLPTGMYYLKITNEKEEYDQTVLLE